MKKAVIFDFNGTLFFDTHKHDEAWRGFAEKLFGRPMTQAELDSIMGRNNKLILKFLLGREPSDAEVLQMGEEKEAIYRRLCLADSEFCRLAPGAAEVLDTLKENNTPIAIATSSGVSNIDFYFDRLGIGRWFTRDFVIYDDGTINGKPAPDIYLRAAERLGVPARDCVVFEDAVSGIAAATAAGIGKVYAVASATSAKLLKEQPGVTEVIADYTALTDIKNILA